MRINVIRFIIHSQSFSSVVIALLDLTNRCIRSRAILLSILLDHFQSVSMNIDQTMHKCNVRTFFGDSAIAIIWKDPGESLILDLIRLHCFLDQANDR